MEAISELIPTAEERSEYFDLLKRFRHKDPVVPQLFWHEVLHKEHSPAVFILKLVRDSVILRPLYKNLKIHFDPPTNLVYELHLLLKLGATKRRFYIFTDEHGKPFDAEALEKYLRHLEDLIRQGKKSYRYSDSEIIVEYGKGW